MRTFEPRSALVGGADGLDVVRQVIQAAGAALAPGGRLLMEIGYGQAAAVRRIVVPDGESLFLLHVRDDLQGTPRVVVAERRRASATSSG